MKFIIFFACACACACAMSAAHASEYTITVNDADRDITAEELFAITNAESEVTRVVKAGAKALIFGTKAVPEILGEFPSERVIVKIVEPSLVA